jgi:hypothetical protein
MLFGVQCPKCPDDLGQYPTRAQAEVVRRSHKHPDDAKVVVITGETRGEKLRRERE